LRRYKVVCPNQLPVGHPSVFGSRLLLGLVFYDGFFSRGFLGYDFFSDDFLCSDFYYRFGYYFLGNGFYCDFVSAVC
jgi:hypothetical protein